MERQYLRLSNFPPCQKERKYAFVVQGPGNEAVIGSSIDHMLTFFSAERNFDGVIYLPTGTGHRRHLFSHDTLPLQPKNFFGALDELLAQVKETDTLVTAFFGQTTTHDSHLSFALPEDYIYCRDIVVALKRAPCHVVDYVTTFGRSPGTLAHYLGGLRHAELGYRHVGIAPVEPRVPLPSESFREGNGKCHVSPFHYRLFQAQESRESRAEQPFSVHALFQTAAAFQRGQGGMPPYMCHAQTLDPAQLSL